MWLGRGTSPGPLAGLAGTRKAVETIRRTGRFPVWRREGSSRLTEVPVVDPALVRGLDVGQVAYIYRGGVTYVQVKRLVAAPAAVTPAPAATASAGPGAAGPAWTAAGSSAAELPDVSALLEAAFGPEP